MGYGDIDIRSVNTPSQTSGVQSAETQGTQPTQTGSIGGKTVKQISGSDPIQEARVKDELLNGMRSGDGQKLTDRSLSSSEDTSFFDDFVVLEKDVFDWADGVADRLKEATGDELDSGQRAEIVGAFADKISGSSNESIKYLIKGRTVGELREAAKRDASEPVPQLLHKKFADAEADYVRDYVRLFKLCDRRKDAHDGILATFAGSNAKPALRTIALNALEACRNLKWDMESCDDDVTELEKFFGAIVERMLGKYVEVNGKGKEEILALDDDLDMARESLRTARRKKSGEDKIRELEEQVRKLTNQIDERDGMRVEEDRMALVAFLVRAARVMWPKFDLLLKKGMHQVAVDNLKTLRDWHAMRILDMEKSLVAVSDILSDHVGHPTLTVQDAAEKYGFRIPNDVHDYDDLEKHRKNQLLPEVGKSRFLMNTYNELAWIVEKGAKDHSAVKG